MAETRMTTEHEEIRRWAEKCGGAPATVAGTERGEEPGLLRFKFRADSDGKLQQISWDDFFEKFDKENLALLYRDDEEDEACESRFFKFVDRRRAH
jgi:hypothetical protein